MNTEKQTICDIADHFRKRDEFFMLNKKFFF